MAQRRTSSRGGNLESDSCIGRSQTNEMVGPPNSYTVPANVPGENHSSASRGEPSRHSTARRIQGLTESDGCRPVRQTLPPTEPNRDSKLQNRYTGSPIVDFRSSAMPQGTKENTMEWFSQIRPVARLHSEEGGGVTFIDQIGVDRRSSPEQRTFDSGTFVDRMTADRQPSPDQKTFGSGTFMDQMVTERRSSPEQRTFGSGTFVDQMTADRQPSPAQDTFGSGTFVDQMVIERRSSPEQRTFGTGTFVDQMKIGRQPSPDQKTYGSGTIMDQVTIVSRSSPEQRTFIMYPTQLDDEMIEDRDPSDEYSWQSLITTGMKNWTIEDNDDDIPSPEPTSPVDPAVFAQDEDGDTNLHLAIISERIDQALALIYLAPDLLWLDLSNSLKQTPLHLATIRRQPIVIRRLLSRGAKRVVYDRRGNTPLHIACLNGHLDCVQELTSSCPTPVMTNDDLGLNVPNYEGQTCLYLAASRNQLDVIRYLVENHGVNVNQKELKRGYTLLHRAVMTSNLELLEYLLNLPASAELIVDEPTYDGYTALQLAHLTPRQMHIVQMLLSAGAHPSGFDDDWPPPQA